MLDQIYQYAFDSRLAAIVWLALLALNSVSRSGALSPLVSAAFLWLLLAAVM